MRTALRSESDVSERRKLPSGVSSKLASSVRAGSPSVTSSRVMRVDVVDVDVEHARRVPDLSRAVDPVDLVLGAADHHDAVAALEPRERPPLVILHPRLATLTEAEGTREELERGDLVAVAE